MSHTALGQRLLAAGLINPDQLRIALIEQGKSRQRLGQLLHQLGFASEGAIHDVLAEQLALPRYRASHHEIHPAAIGLIPAELARRYRLLPLTLDTQARRLRLAMTAPNDPQTLASLQSPALAGFDLELLLAGDNEIERAIDLHYGHALAIDELLDALEGKPLAAASGNFSGDFANDANNSPAVRLIDALLGDAVRQQASDIHFEPESACLRIRYRIDGVLSTIRILHKSTWPALSSRLKILAGMNIAETRALQDGQISQQIAARQIDFRVASQPTITVKTWSCASWIGKKASCRSLTSA